MDADRFDRLTRTLAARLPRRGALRWLGGLGLGALLGSAAVAPVAAAPCGPDTISCKVRRKGRDRIVCVEAGQCCPGQRLCGDQCVPSFVCCNRERQCWKKVKGRFEFESCVPRTQCCPHDRICPGNVCVDPVFACCPDERFCRPTVNGAICVPAGQCCPDERLCPDGNCVKKGECCFGERECTSTRNGKTRTSCVALDQCCPGKKRCPDRSCVEQGACCPGQRECKRRVNGKVRTTCVAGDQCCPGTEVPCPASPSLCCNRLAGEECASEQGCCDTLVAEKHVCDGKWCCDKNDQCIAGVGCRKPSQCPPGETDCAAPNGEITACCDPGELCCNGICCAKSIAPVSKCCGTRQACYGINSPCPA